MKKRIASLVMCMLMLVTSVFFSSCSSCKGDEGFIVDPNAPGENNELMTICIYGITDKSTTPSAILKVEEALNEITVKKFNTKIDLLLFPEEIYASILLSKTQTAMNTYNSQLLSKPGITAEDKKVIKNVDFSTINGLNVATEIPSEVVNSTLDIFLVYTPSADSPTMDSDSEYYNKPIANNGLYNILYDSFALAPLKSMIKDGSYSALRTNAYPEALKCVEGPLYKDFDNPNATATDYYGIPNNYIYGKYEFIMFNHTYVDSLVSSKDKSDLAMPQTDKKLPNGEIVREDCPALRALKLELQKLKDEGKLVKKDAQGNVVEGVDVEIEKQFNSYEDFEDYLKKGGECAIGIIKGDLATLELCKASGLYDVYKRDIAPVKILDFCQSMFCISRSATDRMKRCLDILLLINTDAQFRNILQYGVKNVHYTESRDGTVFITGSEGDVYSMNPLYTGNMFIMAPNDRMSETMRRMAADKWLLGKLQTNEVIERFTGEG